MSPDRRLSSRWPAPLLLALGLVACGGEGIATLGEASEETFSEAELAYPGREGMPRQATLRMGEVERTIEYQEIEGEAIFEGDIILDLPVGEDGTRSDALAAVTAPALWPNGVIPYTISSSLPNRSRVIDAIAHWHANTGIRLVPRRGERDYVTFTSGSGCSSQVGRRGGQQTIKLGSGCSTGNVIHEIGHAVGVWHEQSRADRDRHIRINWNNIQRGAESNFRTYIERGYQGQDVGGYDVLSIMHYGSNAFSRNGRPTITRLDGSTFSQQRRALTATDLAGIKQLYGFP